MINGICAASSALNAFSKKVAVVSNNVANMNSDGFKKSRTISVSSFSNRTWPDPRGR